MKLFLYRKKIFLKYLVNDVRQNGPFKCKHISRGGVAGTLKVNDLPDVKISHNVKLPNNVRLN